MSLPVFLKSLHSIGLPWHGLIKLNTSGTSCTLTRDSDDVVMTMPTALFAYQDAWRLQKDGIGAASTPAAVSALGGEWRNEALQPNASRGSQVFFDESGKPWVIKSRSVEVVSGDVVISLGVRPFGIFGDGVDYSSNATVSATISGLTGLDEDGVGHLASVSLNGRKHLYTILERDNNPTSCTQTMTLGIIEVTISGSGTYTTWPGTFAGLSVTATVLKTTEDCAWEITDSVAEGDTEDCHQMLEQTRIWHAWYDHSTYDIVYLTHTRTIEDWQTSSEIGTYPPGPRSWSFTSDLRLFEAVSDGTNTITGATLKRTYAMSGNNNGSDWVQTGVQKYYLGATQVGQVDASINEVGVGGDVGGAGPASCGAYASFSELINWVWLVYDLSGGVFTTSHAAQRVRLISNNLVGIFSAVGVLHEPADTAQWDGFLHPGGTEAGFAAAGSVSTALFNGAITVTAVPSAPYGAYNPYNGDVVVGQSDRVGYV